MSVVNGRDAMIVAKTLRQLAEWDHEDRSPRSLAELAQVVETEDWPDALCCPMCQEVECDTGCPLEDVRSRAEGAGK